MIYNVLEFCRHNCLPLIYSSSREVYGDVRRPCTGESDADFRFSESPYAASKIAGEAWVYAYAQCYGLRYIVFRFSNVYGRYDNDLERMERVIPLFIQKIAAGEPVTLYGPEKLLDFTYVDDCVDGIRRGIDLLASGEGADHTLNLAYGQGNSLVTLAELIGESLGRAPEKVLKPSREGEVTHYVADISAARAILGYDPTTSLREGIVKTIAWSTAWVESHRLDG
jgi:UDP-glucose 4-epimerase